MITDILMVGFLVSFLIAIQWRIHTEDKRMGLTRRQLKEQNRRWKMKQCEANIAALEIEIYGHIVSKDLNVPSYLSSTPGAVWRKS